MRFCPLGQDFLHPWENGLNRCFLWTTSTISSLLISAIAIAVYAICFCRNSRRSEPRVKTCGYRIQVAFSFLIIVVTLIHVMTFAIGESKDNQSTSGFTILCAIGMPLSWIVAFSLLLIERRRICPRLYLRGHGFPLILYWMGNLVLINLPLTSVGNDSWWWKRNEYVRFAFSSFF